MAGTALITGGAKRIGRQLTLGLARKGWNVALHYHRSDDAALQTQEEVESFSVRCTLHQADLGSFDELMEMAQSVFSRYPDLELLINNASVYEKSGLRSVNEEVFNRQFDINFKAPFFLMQHFQGVRGHGHIVNLLDTRVTSDHEPSYTAYHLAKQALMHLTRTAALDFAPGIRVNAIAPGPAMAPEGHPDSYLKQRIRDTPLQRTIDSLSIEQALHFLLENVNVTGQIIFCDNGAHLH